MRLVGRSLLLLLTALVALLLFAPKKELFYLLERPLQTKQIYLDVGTLREHPFGLDLSRIAVRVEGVELGDIGTLRIRSYLLYTTLSLHDFVPAEGMEKFLPISIREARAVYSLLHPLEVPIRVSGSFGSAVGSFSLKDRRLRLRLVKVGELGPLRPYLKKSREGWIYEQRF